MNTKQILRDLSQMSGVKKQNFDVVPANYLPSKIPKNNRPFYLVVNTSASFEGSGEHWVSMYIPRKYNQNIEYFDSFGLPAINKYFIKFLSNNCKNYVYNPVQLQSDTSLVCGQYCTVFLHERCTKRKSLKHFITQFSPNDREMNDSMIRRMYRKIHNHNKTTRVQKKKMTQHGRGLYCNVICNQTCVARTQMRGKMRKHCK